MGFDRIYVDDSRWDAMLGCGWRRSLRGDVESTRRSINRSCRWNATWRCVVAGMGRWDAGGDECWDAMLKERVAHRPLLGWMQSLRCGRRHTWVIVTGMRHWGQVDTVARIMNGRDRLSSTSVGSH